ncbi:MAG: aminopeptidase [Bacillota bacterium]
MPTKKVSPGRQLAEKLMRQEKNAWDSLEKDEEAKVQDLAAGYKDFLSLAKTERRAISKLVEIAGNHGFIPWEQLAVGNRQIAAGTRFYATFKGKAAIFGIWGQEGLDEGLNIIGAHVDSPRLDLKPNPLYQSSDLGLFKTHYYGGIKKYQWVAIPLALHGVVILSDGQTIDVEIGEKEDDPVFTVTDLLPHLAKDQVKKKLQDAISGEELNILIGSIPYGKDKEVKDRIKLALMDYLNRRYGMVEEDFISAELEAVPSGPARDIGLDGSMVGGYGQDDRICVYTAMKALIDVQQPRKTVLALLMDKEEIGSDGNTGMQSRFLINSVAELCNLCGRPREDASRILARSKALSADVNAGIDPTYESVMDKLNAARLGGGVVLTKYTGAGGKYESNDAHAEFLVEVRRLFNNEGLIWQTGELGKVDQGGGGTIAKYLGAYGMNVVDCGPPILGMHSPLEVSSKADIYMTYRAYRAFFND